MGNEAWLTLSQLVIALGLVLGGVGGVLAAVGGYGAYHFGKRVEDDAAKRGSYTGVLESAGEVLVSAEKHIWPQLEFGDSGAILTFAGPSGSPLIEFSEDS